MRIKRKKGSRYVRIATFDLNEVLPFVFTEKIQYALKESGYKYNSKKWKNTSRRGYTAVIDGISRVIQVSMGSHRYQLFAEKGTTCVECGIKGSYFALERGLRDNPDRFHFNLYGLTKQGREMMITKDHIVPFSKGGRNKLSNYQTMCFFCNQQKGNKLIL